MTSCNKPDFNTDLYQLDEIDMFFATCWQVGDISEVKKRKYSALAWSFALLKRVQKVDSSMDIAVLV